MNSSERLAALCLLSLALYSPLAFGLNANEIWERYRFAVVRITLTGTKENHTRLTPPEMGSGFIVYSADSRTVVVTAAHVLRPDSYWEENGATGGRKREVKIESLDLNGKLRVIADRVTVLKQDDEHDWAILQFNGEGYRSVNVGTMVKPGTSAYLLGFPAGKEIVDPSIGDVKATDHSAGSPHLRLYMPVDTGQSGGPIFDEFGKVTAIARENERTRQYSYHVATPVSLLISTLREHVPENAQCWSEPGARMNRETSSTAQNDAYSLKLHSVRWHHYYKAGGDFTGIIAYDVTNTSSMTIMDLLPDKAGWSGKQLEAKHEFRILTKDRPFYTLSKSVLVPFEREEGYYGATIPMTYFMWLPRISPGLKPQERIEYAVVITTHGTERDAFGPEGAFGGMGTQYPAGELLGEFNAPAGYRIILRGYVIRDRTGSVVEPQHGVEEPRLSADHTRVDWRVKTPITSAVYLVSIRFEPRE